MQVVILINALDHTPRIRNDTSITVIMNYPDSDDRDTQVLGLHYTRIYKYPHIIYAIILTYIELTMAQVVPQYSIILYITLKHSLLFTFITLSFLFIYIARCKPYAYPRLTAITMIYIYIYCTCRDYLYFTMPR